MSETAAVAVDPGGACSGEQFDAAKNGASVEGLMTSSYYPLSASKRAKPTRTSVSFSAEEYADLQLIADLWNAMDKALKTKRKKWKVASVIEHLANVGVNGFWDQVGGRPASKHDREEWLSQAIERLQKVDEQDAPRPPK